MSKATGYKALSTRPLPEDIVEKIKEYSNPLKASKLVAWVKLTSGAGLTLVSNPNIPTFGVKSIHGTFDSSAPIGLEGFGESSSNSMDGISGVGYRPRPIIESVEIKNGKRGLSRKATIKVKCFTMDQLQEMAKYFNEPGLTIAVEFGWNNNNALSRVKQTVGSLGGLNNDKIREADASVSKNDYESFLGNITGGGMSISDGAFDLTIEATGLGELALNLQQNQQSICTNPDESTDTKGLSIKDFIKAQLEPMKKIVVNTWTSLLNLWEKTATTDWKKVPFLEMYADLPSEYQIQRVKDLAKTEEVGSYYNFVGFNEDAKEKTYTAGFWGRLLETVTGISVAAPTMGKVDLDGEKLLDEERFIRFGSLMRILEAANIIKLDEGIDLGGGNKIPLDVNTRNVPIGAHHRIFSTNKSKLLILNALTPDFGFAANFENPERNDTSIYVFYGNGSTSDVPPPLPTIITTYPEQVPGTFDNGYFVRSNALTAPNNISASKYSWGYLEDLYINFDFAFEIIKKEGILKKDAILEMLNGMSSAVNNMWDFEIVEDVDDSGNKMLSVADMNFVGFNTKIEFPSFVTWGSNSPFTSFSLDIDIPAAMRNQIIAKRLTKGGLKVNQSLTDPHPALWSDSGVVDQIMIAMKTRIPDPCENEDQPEANVKDALNKNAQEFAKKAGVFLKPVNPDDVKDDLLQMAKEHTLYVGTFNDSAILNNIKVHDMKIGMGNDLKSLPGPLLPITVTFTVIGTGGFQFGHSFKVNDIFKKFAETGVFQIREVTHNINGNTWETTVEAQFRPLGA
jgi:hypothetical protein